MKFNALLLAGICFIGTFVSAKADILGHWTTNQITFNNTFFLDSIAYGNGVYAVACEDDDDAAIYTSTNGLDWVQTMHEAGPWGLNLNYVNGQFLGNGGYEFSVISTNGTNWALTHTPIGSAFDTFGGITFGDGIYKKVGETNNVGCIVSSTDGTNWEFDQISPSPGGYISSVAYGSSWFVAIGKNDGYAYACHLSSSWFWARQAIPGGSQVSYGDGLFIVPLNNGTNLVASAPFFDWTQVSTGLTNTLSDVSYSDGLFIAQAGNYFATSANGTDWFQYAVPLPSASGGYNCSVLASDGAHIALINTTGGYPGNGFAYLSETLVDVRMTNGPGSQVALSGLVGRNYQIQSTDALTSGSNNWSTNLSTQLTNTPYVWTDNTATNSARFYRGVLLP